MDWHCGMLQCRFFFPGFLFQPQAVRKKKGIPCVSSLHLGATRGLRRFDRVARLERLLAALPAHRAACMFFVLQTFCERDKKYENGTYFMHRCGMSWIRAACVQHWEEKKIANSSKKRFPKPHGWLNRAASCPNGLPWRPTTTWSQTTRCFEMLHAWTNCTGNKNILAVFHTRSLSLWPTDWSNTSSTDKKVRKERLKGKKEIVCVWLLCGGKSTFRQRH